MLDRFAYTAMTGAKHAMGQLANTTNNLANAQTPGFREMLASFRAVPVSGARADSRAFVVDSTPGSNFTMGPIVVSEDPFDVALVTEGFLSVRRADGSEGYTRAGKMVRAADGALKSITGNAIVNADGGDIEVPEGTTNLVITPDGVVRGSSPDGEPVYLGRLKLVDVNPRLLDRGLDGLFETGGVPLPASDRVRVRQGAFEMSNVNVAESMVDMIEQNRMFDLNIRLVQVAEQNARTAGALMSLSRV